MSSFNKITIVGYLGRDPELRYTPDGTAVCNFTIATTEKRKDIAGAERETTTWFRVTAWRRTAEIAHEYLAKGQRVYVEGRLRLETYTDREGAQRFSVEVTATEIHFLESRQTGGDQSGEAEPRTRKGATTDDQAAEYPGDSDIPF